MIASIGPEMFSILKVWEGDEFFAVHPEFRGDSFVQEVLGMGDFLEKVGLPSSLYKLQWACKVVNGEVNHPHLCRLVLLDKSEVVHKPASLMMFGTNHTTTFHWILNKKNVVMMIAREELSRSDSVVRNCAI